MKKTLSKTVSYLLNYFGYTKDFNKLRYFIAKHNLWILYNFCILIYLLPRFIFMKTKVYLYLKPSWFIRGLKSKYLQAKDSGYKGYDNYEEYDQERRIDWGRDMYK